MKNITITLDEKTAVWARVHAAKHNKSVSRLVGEMLQKHMHESREYEEAMRRFFSYKPVKFVLPGGRYPTREELHDRASLRRR
jgi:hypothetical protein